MLDSADTSLTVADKEEAAYLPLPHGQVNSPAINAGVGTSGSFGHATDGFGIANAAMQITSDPEQLRVSNISNVNPSNGATLIMWIKVDPRLPPNG